MREGARDEVVGTTSSPPPAGRFSPRALSASTLCYLSFPFHVPSQWESAPVMRYSHKSLQEAVADAMCRHGNGRGNEEGEVRFGGGGGESGQRGGEEERWEVRKRRLLRLGVGPWILRVVVVSVRAVMVHGPTSWWGGCEKQTRVVETAQVEMGVLSEHVDGFLVYSLEKASVIVYDSSKRPSCEVDGHELNDTPELPLIQICTALSCDLPSIDSASLKASRTLLSCRSAIHA